VAFETWSRKMSDDGYLWDKSQPADPFVAKLESLLEGKRAKARAAGRPRRNLRIVRFAAAIAAAAALLVLGSYLATKLGDPVDQPAPSSCREANGSADAPAAPLAPEPNSALKPEAEAAAPAAEAPAPEAIEAK